MSLNHSILTALTTLALGSITAQATEFIRQTQLSSGITWDFYPTQGQGSTWSPIPVGKGGSSFSLYATGNSSTPRIFKLDESTMGTDFPTVELTIHSTDPHQPARTRADQPFSVTMKRHGSTTKAITVKHGLETYNPSTHNSYSHPVQKQTWWQLPIKSEQHGKFFPSIPATSPTQAEGEETFTAYTAGTQGKQLYPLKSASIQVWPVASVNIKGLTNQSTVKSNKQLQQVVIHCKNLYPDSVTYAQIYRGKAKLGTLGRILPQTIVRFDTEVPQNQKIPLGDWANTLSDGTYTLEVLHITPFNQRKPERLAHTSFVIDRGMHSPGLVHNQF